MFYTYRQNNSGGSFKITKKIKRFVIIEADFAKKQMKKQKALVSILTEQKKEQIVLVVVIDGIERLQEMERKHHRYMAKMSCPIWHLGRSCFMGFT